MQRIRKIARGASRSRTFLPTLAATLLLIAGLLTMHTLNGGTSGGHAEHAGAPVASAHADAADGLAAHGLAAHGLAAHAGMVDPAAPPVAGHAAATADSGSAPDHSAWMSCILALLVGILALLAPTLVGRLASAAAARRAAWRAAAGALPHPRPPSLIVLSISRT